MISNTLDICTFPIKTFEPDHVSPKEPEREIITEVILHKEYATNYI